MLPVIVEGGPSSVGAAAPCGAPVTGLYISISPASVTVAVAEARTGTVNWAICVAEIAATAPTSRPEAERLFVPPAITVSEASNIVPPTP